ncbi:apses-domain-containing protein [Panus rudis PR-1116 ss-1]|nr:apses-domain-containing protein [Panus rudis PR-1116 ss-1]
MPDGQIFKATYSGIPVYEMMCKGVAVMRRRADSWLNATQILKVAGFDKPQRTRILEREVQKGEHEKVQGGYGKYQGTWIPLERGIALCKQYNIEHLLLPILDFQADASSPPLAPKHLVTQPTVHRPTPKRGEAPAASNAISTRSSRRLADIVDESERETLSARGSEDGTMTPSPSEASSSSRTPSPIRSSPSPSSHLGDGFQSPTSAQIVNRKRKARAQDDDSEDVWKYDQANYADEILEYFISDSNQIPSILINPPPNFDPNMAIDDDGHTALHWASAMGRIRIVKLLLSAGADIFRVNKAGQTALMRSVMFANNYDVRKFPELYEVLHRSTLNIDHHNRTVFHHIVDVAMSKGKTHAARYYMETVIHRLSEYPRELADVVNFQDEDGETPLTMAARCRSKRLVKLLLDHGGDPKIRNNDGKNTEDYILEDERFRSSPMIPSRTLSMSYRNAQAASGLLYDPLSGASDRPTIHQSVAAHKAATRCTNDIAVLLDNLAASYDQEIREKERERQQAFAVNDNIHSEILEGKRHINALVAQAQSLPQARKHLQELEDELRIKMGTHYRLAWEKWIKDEEEREKAIRNASNGELVTSLDVNDLLSVHANVPTDPQAMKEECEKYRVELAGFKKRRLEFFDELVKFQEEAGTGGRMADYRRLISAGCGGVPTGEVDNVIGMLLETLENEEPNATSAPWASTSAPKAGSSG